MTRFIYLCDSHLAATAPAYTQQPAYFDRQAELLHLLDQWIRRDGGIDFVLHGGDMIHATHLNTLQQAAELFQLSVPVYLCLGNHDLTEPQAHHWWLEHAPAFFPHGTVDYTWVTEDCALHVFPNQWGELPYYWGERQDAAFLPEQQHQLARALTEHPDRLHILSTHAPSRGLPPAQTGFDTPYHGAPLSFEAEINACTNRCHDLRLVLSAHSHLTMHRHEAGTHYVSCSSFVEAPFEFKLIEVEANQLSMATHSLAHQVSFRWRYDFSKTYVQGRPVDRTI